MYSVGGYSSIVSSKFLNFPCTLHLLDRLLYRVIFRTDNWMINSSWFQFDTLNCLLLRSSATSLSQKALLASNMPSYQPLGRFIPSLRWLGSNVVLIIIELCKLSSISDLLLQLSKNKLTMLETAIILLLVEVSHLLVKDKLTFGECCSNGRRLRFVFDENKYWKLALSHDNLVVFSATAASNIVLFLPIRAYWNTSLCLDSTILQMICNVLLSTDLALNEYSASQRQDKKLAPTSLNTRSHNQIF